MKSRTAKISCALMLVSSLAAAKPPGGTPPGQAKKDALEPQTVQVDCGQGDSVAAALLTPASELTIEITGICDEDIEILRDDVTLIGADPALDGLRGVSTEPVNTPPVVSIHQARNVRIEKLGIYDGLGNGISASQVSRLRIQDCAIEGHGRDGLLAVNVSGVAVVDTSLQAGRIGVGSVGVVNCTRCTIDAGVAGFVAFEGQNNLIDSTVTATGFGAYAQYAGALDVSGSSLSGPWGAVATIGNAHLLVNNSTIDDGPIYCEDDSSITLRGVTMLVPSYSIVTQSCSLL